MIQNLPPCSRKFPTIRLIKQRRGVIAVKANNLKGFDVFEARTEVFKINKAEHRKRPGKKLSGTPENTR